MRFFRSGARFSAAIPSPIPVDASAPAASPLLVDDISGLRLERLSASASPTLLRTVLKGFSSIGAVRAFIVAIARLFPSVFISFAAI